MISYKVGNVTTEVRQWNFPGGEIGVDINVGSQTPNAEVNQVIITARIKNSDDVMGLVLSHDAIKRQYPFADLVLYLPYIPYGRQDRVCNNGESHSLKVFGRLINSMGFKSVNTIDPHSIVSAACIDNFYHADQFTVFGSIKTSFREWTIVAPDQGATKKCEDFAKNVGAAGVITFSKTRELSTGQITGMKPNQEIDPLGKYLVLDDICDGGRTFIELAKCFSHTACDLELAVTHGIFSKGVEVVAEEFDHVYTTNSFRDDLVSTDEFTVIKF